MAVKTYRKTALVTAEQFRPEIGQIPSGVYSDGHGDPRVRQDCSWVLDTKEARHTLRGGDYICTGPAGEQWNVAQEIFENTYEEVLSSTPVTKPAMGEWIEPRAGSFGVDWNEEWLKMRRKYRTLAKAAQAVVSETDRIHDNEPWPIKYRAPYEAITQLLAALDSEGKGHD